MIDLTPLDVRKKRGDFRRILRGYEPEEVDTFLQLVAERMEELVKENLSLSEKVERLQQQVGSLEGRERAVHDALVTAERLRSDVKEQAAREAEVVRREAESDARRILEDAERMVAEHRGTLAGLERERRQFLGAFRALLERQMERLETEEGSVGEGSGAPVQGRGESSRRVIVAGGTGIVAGGTGGIPQGEGAAGTGPPPSQGAPVVSGEGEEGLGEAGKAPAGPGGADQPEDLSSWLAGFLEGEGDEPGDR